ncbi:hypothetical protein GCM10027610_101460 [Dactylosporangium cerinum]
MQGVEEAADRGGRVHRIAWIEPAQVHIQLTVGEVAADPVRPVHGEGGLAHPRGAVDRGDARGPGRLRTGRRDHRVEQRQLLHPPDERDDVGGQLPGRLRPVDHVPGWGGLGLSQQGQALGPP